MLTPVPHAHTLQKDTTKMQPSHTCVEETPTSIATLQNQPSSNAQHTTKMKMRQNSKENESAENSKGKKMTPKKMMKNEGEESPEVSQMQ